MTLAASKYIPGLGKTFFIQGSELDTAPGAIPRVSLTTDALAPHGIPLYAMKNTDGSTIPAGAAGAMSLFTVNVSANVETLVGQTADSGTKTSVVRFRFVLPQGYVAGGGVKVRLATDLKSVTGSGVADNGSDIVAACYKQAHGAVGSNLVTTLAQVYAALDTWYDKDFVVNPTGLVAGDVLNFLVTARAIENDAGNGTLQSLIGEVAVLLDIKG